VPGAAGAGSGAWLKPAATPARLSTRHHAADTMTNSQIPVNALDRHISPLARELGAAAMAVIDSGYYVLGPNVQAFEQAFARWCGVRDCIGVANGTDALELGLRSMGIASGSVVAVAANAAMYGTTAVLACGAEPVFVDIDAASFN